MRRWPFLFFFLLIFLPSNLYAEVPSTCDLSWQAFRQPGETGTEDKLLVAVTLTPAAHVYLYGPESMDGLPTSVAITAVYEGEPPETAHVSATVPVRQSDTRFAKSTQSAAETLIYDGPAVFTGILPYREKNVTITVVASGLLCTAANCTLYNEDRSFDLSTMDLKSLTVPAALKTGAVTPVNPEAVSKTSDSSPSPDSFDFSYISPRYFQPFLEVQELGSALLFGLIAGVLLNLMPCVLPVVSLKFSSLMAVSAMADKQAQARAFKTHCLIFAAGVLTWFFVLAFMLGLAGWAWGELFQSPVVICILGLLLFLLGLSLFGVFSLPILNLKVSNGSNPHVQAFISGLLATLLATPCSGPLLGGVLGWALRQPLPVLVLTVTSVGVGMAFPYGVMAFNPRLVHLLPKPGNWTIRLEQLLGFFLMASVIYLVTLLPAEWVGAFLMNLFAVAFAAWLWGQIGHLRASFKRRAIARACAILTICLAAWWGYLSLRVDANWEPFVPSSFEQLLGKEPLLLEFTADWCPSCKAMEHTTLSEARMTRLRDTYKMRMIRVDMTRDDAAAKELLKALGSSSIPVLALFPKGEEAAKSPLVLRDIVTPQQLKDALAKTF